MKRAADNEPSADQAEGGRMLALTKPANDRAKQS